MTEIDVEGVAESDDGECDDARSVFCRVVDESETVCVCGVRVRTDALEE